MKMSANIESLLNNYYYYARSITRNEERVKELDEKKRHFYRLIRESFFCRKKYLLEILSIEDEERNLQVIIADYRKELYKCKRLIIELVKSSSEESAK
jgi:hypothetical protein